MASKTTWVYKRENPAKGLPKVFRVDPEKAGRWGTKVGDTCAIAVPKDIDNFIKKVPKGKIVTINELRQAVAKKYKSDIACPITQPEYLPGFLPMPLKKKGRKAKKT